MKVITLDRDVPEVWTIGPAVDAVKRGEFVIFPTDSIYALGCDPWNRSAVATLYAAKGMDKSKACAVLCPDMKSVGALTRAITDEAFHFMRAHLPGPYTILLKASRELPKNATGKRKTIGVRMPDHDVALALVEELEAPLLVTSVPDWIDGELIDPVDVAKRLYKRPAVVLDQGPQRAEPSTVIDFTGDEPALIRQGKGEVDLA